MKLIVTCRTCDRVLRVPLGKPIYFHRCSPRRRIRPPRGPSYVGTTAEEARRAVYWAAVQALGGEPSIWRPLDAEAER